MNDRIPTLVPIDIDLERIAERARRRDMFAAAALTGLLARPSTDGNAGEYASEAVKYSDATLAALDATHEPTSASVPPSPATRPGETERP